MATTEQITTAAQLLDAPDLGRCELVRGELIMMSPAGFRHARIANRIGAILLEFIEEHALGVVTGAEGGFQIARDPDTVRAPDVAFVRAERVPVAEPLGFFPGAPDLAVEVLSPSDRAGEVLAKVQDWLEAGCRAVWVVDPHTETITDYRSRSEVTVLTKADTLSGGAVLPGFTVAVAKIFGSSTP